MQPDIIETTGGCLIQHGKFNDRIYLMKVGDTDLRVLPQALIERAEEQDYSKIFCKIPMDHAREFIENGYICEAEIKGFYGGKRSAALVSYFLKPWRSESSTEQEDEEVIKVCRDKRSYSKSLVLPEGAKMRICLPEDAETMAELYGQVFETYPFAIDDPKYLTETMESHVIYFGIWIDDELAALSSAEMDEGEGNVEMTDFATLPKYRGQGLAVLLLQAMEAKMCIRGFSTAYTIARAVSMGMNITFSRMGYHFGGRLINNTQIAGKFEDMNVWSKSLV